MQIYPRWWPLRNKGAADNWKDKKIIGEKTNKQLFIICLFLFIFVTEMLFYPLKPNLTPHKSRKPTLIFNSVLWKHFGFNSFFLNVKFIMFQKSHCCVKYL